MDLHKFIGETLKINEGYRDTEEPVEEPVEAPVEAPVEDAGVAQAPEINDELIASLENDLPGLKDVDQEELKKGLADEMEHFNTVGGDVAVIAKITLDHLNEFPGQKYYTALEQLESELSKAAEQDVAPAPEAEPVAQEPAPEAPVEEPVAMEAKVSEETVAGGLKTVAIDREMMKKETAEMHTNQDRLKKEEKKTLAANKSSGV